MYHKDIESFRRRSKHSYRGHRHIMSPCSISNIKDRVMLPILLLLPIRKAISASTSITSYLPPTCATAIANGTSAVASPTNGRRRHPSATNPRFKPTKSVLEVGFVPTNTSSASALDTQKQDRNKPKKTRSFENSQREYWEEIRIRK